MDVGDLIAQLRLDNKPFKKTLRQSSQQAKASFGMTEKAAKDSSRRMGESIEGFGRRSANASDKMAKGWWKTFGKVAVGFTIAYRAMNAFEEGLKKLIGTFISGRQEIDDFRMAIVEVAASLQMLTEQPTTEGLEAYYKFARGMFESLELIAAKHISTGEDLRNAYAKLATMGIVPQTEKQLEQMARLVDLIIIQTKGLDKQRQIRTELQSFVLGEMRQGAVVARMMSQRIADYDEVIERVQEEGNVAKKTQMIFDDTGKILDAVGSVSKDIQKTHTALWTTLTAYLAKIQRLGLLQMYEDLLNIMIKIRDSIMDQNGLTDLGVKLATAYHTSWASVWGVTKGVAKILRDILWIMSPLATLLKYTAATTVVIAAGWEKIGAIINMDLFRPGTLLIRLTNINEEMIKTLDDILMGHEEMQAKYVKQMKAYQIEVSKYLDNLATEQKEASNEATKNVKKWIDSIEDLKEKYIILSKVLESVKGTVFTAEDLKSFEWLWKTVTKLEEVPEKLQSQWMKVQIALSRVTKELELAGERSKVFLEINKLKEKFAILGKIYDMLKKGAITSEQVDRAIKIEELERKRLELIKLIGEEAATEWLLYQKAILNLGDWIELEGRALEKFKVDFKEISRLIKEQKDLLKGPTIADFLRRQNLIISGGRRRISESEWNQLFEENLTLMGEAYKKFLDNLQDAFANTFEDIFSSQLDSWKDLMGSMKKLFIRTLAEMAAKAAREKIETSITTGKAAGATPYIAGALLGYSIYASYKAGKRETERMIQEAQARLAEAFRAITGEIEDMLSTAVGMEKVFKDIRKQFSDYRKTIRDLGGSIEQLNWIRQKEIEVVEETRRKLVEEFIAPLEEMIAQFTMSDIEYELYGLEKWYKDRIDDARILGEESVKLLREAYELSKKALILKEREALLSVRAGLEETILTLDMTTMQLQVHLIEKAAAEMSDTLSDTQDRIDALIISIADAETDRVSLQSQLDAAITEWAEGGPMGGWEAYKDFVDLWAEGGWPAETIEAMMEPYYEAADRLLPLIETLPGEIDILDEAIIAFGDDLALLITELEATGDAAAIAYVLQMKALKDSFIGGLEDIIRSHTMSEYEQGMYALSQWYAEQVIAAELLGVSLDLVNTAYQLQADALAEVAINSSDLVDSLEDWKDVLESIQDQILDISTSMDSPLNALERMALVQEEIAGYGMDYTPEDVQKLQDLWSKYLGIAQEAYQRPSVQYQEIFSSVLDALGGLEDFAEEQISDYEIQLEQLEAQLKMVDLLEGVGSLQHGINYVPETGLYRLHEGEHVSPAGSSEYNLNVTVYGSGSPRETAVAVRQEIEGFFRSSDGRKEIQNISKGQ